VLLLLRIIPGQLSFRLCDPLGAVSCRQILPPENLGILSVLGKFVGGLQQEIFLYWGYGGVYHRFRICVGSIS